MRTFVMFLLIVSCTSHADVPDSLIGDTNSSENQNLFLEEKIKALQEQFDNQSQIVIGMKEQQKVFQEKLSYQNLREELLNRQENRIDTWLSVVGIIITIIGLALPVGAWLLNRRFESRITEINHHVDEIKKLEKEAREHTKVISELRLLSTDQILKEPESSANTKSEDIKNIGKMLKQVFKYEKENSNQAAIQLWQKILNLAKGNENNELRSNAYFSLGYLFHKLNDHKKAIQHYEKSINIDPSCGQAHNNLAVVYDEIGQHEKAIVNYLESLKFAPEDPDTYNNLGVCYRKIEEYDKAIASYQKAIKLKPDFGIALRGLGITYLYMKQPEKAIENFIQAIKLSPEDSSSYNNLGGAYRELQDYQKAITNFEKALKLDPNNSSILFNLGIAYGNLSEHKKATECFEQAVMLDPKDTQAHYYLGIASAFSKSKRSDTEESPQNLARST